MLKCFLRWIFLSPCVKSHSQFAYLEFYIHIHSYSHAFTAGHRLLCHVEMTKSIKTKATNELLLNVPWIDADVTAETEFSSATSKELGA